jgi:hypothetical protein
MSDIAESEVVTCIKQCQNEDQSDEPAAVCVSFSGSAMLKLLACTMVPPIVGSKKRSVLRNFLSQPARSASNEGELHASFFAQTCARCNGFARNRRAITSYRARAVTCCQRARNKPDFHGADRKRAFRQKMDGRAADRQLQGPDRQAGDQAARRSPVLIDESRTSKKLHPAI